MRKKLVFVLSLFFCCCRFFLSTAQQPAQYTIYRYNAYGIHPAAAGAEDAIVATGIYRQQWAGLKGAPISQQINAHLPINKINSGFGINLENDKVGVMQTTAAAVTYAYKMRLTKNATLAMALNGGISQQRINGQDIRTPEGDYLGNSISHKDQVLVENTNTSNSALLDASIYFQRKNLKIGLTAKNLIDNRRNFTINNTKVRLIKNYLFTFASDFELSSNFTLLPSLLLRTDGKEFQGEISLLSEYQKKFTLGTSFRGYSNSSFDALAIIGGIKLNEKLNLLYAYDISLSPLKTVNTGSHEILLQYKFGEGIGKGKAEKIIYNPRYY